MNNEEIKKIDDWLEGLSQESIIRIFTVSSTLRAISELTDATFFSAPYEALDKANLDKTSIVAILTELWRKGIIDLMDQIEGNSVSDWNKGYEGDNSFNEFTMIQIHRPVFEYFIQSLSKSKSKADTIKSVNHSDLASVIPTGGKYRVVRRITKLFTDKNKIPNWKIMACITPILTHGKKFSKNDYSQSNHYPKIKNRSITLKKLWEDEGYTIKINKNFCEKIKI